MDLPELAVQYEKTHGSVEFLKAVGSVINKLLVDKGLVTADEIKNAFVSELTMRNIGSVSKSLSENQVPTTNYMQVVKCECGEEMICFCGRCKGCGKMRTEPKESVHQEKSEQQEKAALVGSCATDGDFRVLANKVDQLWTEIFCSSVQTLGDKGETHKPARQTIRGAVLDLCAVNNVRVDNPCINPSPKVDPPKAPWSI